MIIVIRDSKVIEALILSVNKIRYLHYNLIFFVSHNFSVFQVLDAIQPVMDRGNAREQSVFRAKFSSITDTDIWNAMNRLGEPNRNEALSVDARQELDLRIGCAFTRYAAATFRLITDTHFCWTEI